VNTTIKQAVGELLRFVGPAEYVQTELLANLSIKVTATGVVEDYHTGEPVAETSWVLFEPKPIGTWFRSARCRCGAGFAIETAQLMSWDAAIVEWAKAEQMRLLAGAVRTPEEVRACKLSLYSDFHKDVFGIRPTHPATEDEMIAIYDAAVAELEQRRSTPAGRAALREEGWSI